MLMSPPADDSVPTRQSLLERLKRWDDTGAWREFFATYWELIYNVARKAGLNDAEAQDAVQETVLAVVRKIGEFNTDPRRGSFKSWLLGHARWRISDQFRARKRSAQAIAGGPKPADRIPTRSEEDTTDFLADFTQDASEDRLEAMWNEEWEQHVLRTALERVKAQVTVKQFQIFELHVRPGLSVTDTAKAIGTTKASVYMTKSRVGRLLKREVHALEIQQRRR
jgi:RNA polymerase sigma-70 factor (ECF subfamily)